MNRKRLFNWGAIAVALVAGGAGGSARAMSSNEKASEASANTRLTRNKAK